ncbi:MAG TPA: hypothetical protein VF472_21890 [Burkholderiaceae bacterium]
MVAAAAAVVGAGASVYSASQSGKSSGSATSTQQNTIDPKLAPLLYGTNGQGGLLNEITTAANAPRSPGMQTFGTAADNYMGNNGAMQLNGMTQAADNLMNGHISAPTTSSPWAGTARVSAPNQNNLNLSPAYANMIYGNSGANPYLTGAIQQGIDQANTAYGNLQTNATRNLVNNILPSLRAGAVTAGGYGGSRQQIAEGNAVGDFSNAMAQAAGQVGQNNTDAAVGAQSTSYNQGQDRSLNAMENLSSSQYGTADMNAQLEEQSALANAQMQEQTNLANLNSQLQTNTLNSSNTATGINAASGVLGSAYTYGGNNDTYALNKLGTATGLLSPYTGYGGSVQQTVPLYSNPMGNALGGASAGLGLYNAYRNATAGSGGGGNGMSIWNWNTGGNDGYTMPGGESIPS